MLQQSIAIIVILIFILKLSILYKKGGIARPEYIFWLIFWLLAGASIFFLHSIDRLVAGLGFSASGIAVLTELAIAVIFYFIFRLRLRVAKLEQDITKIVESIALKR